MNLVFNIVFIITAIAIMVFDYKYQAMPLWIVLINYSILSILVNPVFLIGNVVILILKKIDQPIDTSYLVIIGYLIIMSRSIYNVFSILVLLAFILFSKKEKLSYMIPIEIACIFELLIKEVIIK